MKKVCSVVIALIVLILVGTVSATAALPAGTSFTPGRFGVEDPGTFAPVGDIRILWDPAITEKIDLTDGDVSDWYAAGYAPTSIDPSNMVAWVGDHTKLAGWGITAWFVADADYMYFAFDVTDPTFTYSDDHYNGDAIQMCIDYGRKLGDICESNPDMLISPKNIFYSIPCAEDGAPVQIMRQESAQDGWLTEEDGVKGSSRKTNNGWSVEFAMSWDRLYDDYVWKAWTDDPRIGVGGSDELSLKIGCCLYYLDRSETAGTIHWAAGTTKGIIDDSGSPCVSWTPHDNGILLELPWEDGMHFNGKGIHVLPEETVVTEELTEISTELPVTPPVTEGESTSVPAESSSALSDSSDDGGDANDALTASGCSSVIGGATLTALLALSAVAYTFRKKD